MVAQRMEQQYKIKTAVIPADLGASAAVVQVVAEVTKRGIDIDLLVNNAGFGIFERFLEAPLKRQMEQSM
jgi:short-subunit dehydrogenase